MEIEDKILTLEDKGFNYFQISNLLDISYEEVRRISEEHQNLSQLTSEQIEERFQIAVDNLSNEQWWYWVSNWMNAEFIVDMYGNWDKEVKIDAIKQMEELKDKKPEW